MNYFEIINNKVVGVVLLVVAIFLIFGVVSYMKQHREPYLVFKRKEPMSLPTDNVKKHTLKNGMNLLVFENKSVPKVLIQIAYDIGSSVEQEGERGLAHMLEHMIFKGTKELSEGDIDAISRKYGATFNAFTSHDVTSYYFEVNSANWKPFIPILADCMMNSRFDEQHLASEMKAVISELKMLKDSYWRVMMEEALRLCFPSNHPYHFSVIGFKEDLLKMSSGRLKRFYDKYYQPSRATMFVVGDVKSEDVIEEVEKHFSDIESSKEEKPNPFPEVVQEFATNKTTLYRDIEQPQIGFYWRIPGIKSKRDIERQALEIVLGGGEGSRIYKRLVEEEKVASSVMTGAIDLMEAGLFLVLITPHEGQSDKCRELLKEELDKFVSKGITEAELAKVVSNKQLSLLELFEDYQAFTVEWLQSFFATNDELSIFNQVNEFGSMTSEKLVLYVRDYLDPFLMNEIYMVPVPEEHKKRLLEVENQQSKLDSQILNTYVRTTPLEEPKAVHKLPSTQPLDFEFPHPTKTFTLKNGLKVLLYQNKQWPFMTARMYFRDASFFASARSGISISIMMNMLMEGSSDHSKKDNVEFFEGMGTSYNFGVSGAELTVLGDRFGESLKRAQQILLQPTFPADALKKIQAIEIDGYMRSKNDPMAIGLRLLNNEIYKGHQYQWSFDDAIDIIKGLSTRSLTDLHGKYVTPENMILTIVGDYKSDSIEKEITQLFSGWKAAGRIKEIDGQKIAQSKPVTIDHFMVRNQAVLALGRPSPITIEHPDLIPLKLLNYIAFYSMGSRLYKLREATGLFYHAQGAWAYNASREVGFDFLLSLLSVDKLDDAEKGMRAIVKEIADKGVTSDELDVARQLYTKTLIDASSSNASVARVLSTLEAFDLGFDYYDKVLERVNTMTVDEINAIAKKYFSTDNMHRVRVGRVGKEV